VLQHLDESLSDDAGGAENSNRDFTGHMVLDSDVVNSITGRGVVPETSC
jgi:hypothetical protein